MNLQTTVFHQATISADNLRLALTLDADAKPYNWRTTFPTLAALDQMSLQRSALILPDDCPNTAINAYALARLGMPMDTGLAIAKAAALKIPQAMVDLRQNNTNSWFELSPVHWQAGRDNIHLIALNPSDVSIEESKQLLDTIAPWLTELNWYIHVTATQQWFVRSNQAFDYSAPDLHVAVSDQLEHFLPQGNDLKRWQTVLTEIQMAWFNHPVNQVREAKGMLPINSVWLDNASSSKSWSLNAVAEWMKLKDNIYQFKNTQLHKHLYELNAALTTVLHTVEREGNCQITFIGDAWQQDIHIRKRPLSRQLKNMFESTKTPALNWLRSPQFNLATQK